NATLKALQRDRIFHSDDDNWVKNKSNIYTNVFDVIQGKWTIEIYFTLMILEKCGFNELKKSLPLRDGKEINSRTLTDRLHFLERRGIVSRNVITSSPIRVSYSLTNFGKEAFALLIPFLIYYIIPPSIKKKYPRIQKLEELAKELVAQEIE
ncbi:MAG: winged helix-turn-helix transcriptional regulator, partial [Promethearchaeota archaeon]